MKSTSTAKIILDTGGKASSSDYYEEPFETDAPNSRKDAPWLTNGPGIYVDKKTKQALYCSLDLYVSDCGWPNFTKPIDAANIQLRRDNSIGMQRVEVVSVGVDEHGRQIETHLGHVFNDREVAYRFSLLTEETKLQEGEIYISNNGTSSDSFRYSIIDPQGKPQEGIITTKDIPQMAELIKIPFTSEEVDKWNYYYRTLQGVVNAEPLVKAVTAARGHSLSDNEDRYCMNYSALQFIPLKDLKGSPYEKYQLLFEQMPSKEVQESVQSSSIKPSKS